MKRGYEIFKWVSPGNRGVPDDIIFAPNGVVYFAEIKHPGGTGRLSKMQERVIAKLDHLGHDVWVIGSEAGAAQMFFFMEQEVAEKQ